ncbi:glycolate oxidase subunit GlcF [Halochromatium glycolicum]|uniref:Glycolate oxidase iron-sulfur subunit n=1 Tax=Halochromatium glycolicum TaxID=85075 RepID=A0AAJ0U0P7_9GAMM|nr:glycolate oxidase subunit GlcF [Halochromatium glycolicum]MBK1703193.1 glycolate oxidase iron-sulfur subunit [Halochromatium glycolicum]
MQTRLIPSLLETSDGREADRILRSCVHCGFCTATCPTYQLLGDELDGPRGRIYQIKMVLEGEPATRTTQQHLDRCLTCLNCVTTCPSGVEYQKLVEIGREQVEQRVRRPLGERLMRWGLRKVVPYPRRFGPLLRLAQAARPLVPAKLRGKVPVALSTPGPASLASNDHGRQPPRRRRPGRYTRRVLMLDNCVEPALTPATVEATVRVLDALGIEVLQPPGGGCCGAISQHLAAPEEAKGFMRRNIDAWWPMIEPDADDADADADADAGADVDAPAAEAILVTASGCGAVVKEYGWLLRDDPAYAAKAERISALACDLSELLTTEDLARLPSPSERGLPRRIAFHPPCTLQHGQGLMGRVEALLRAADFELTPVRDAHSCCGSAGTYSILQAELSERLRSDRLEALQAGEPALIATANVGCQTHLAAAAGVPVKHWIELFDPQISLASDDSHST